ncbi:tRNA (N(6)-L-threonylcarbamoyladenosine(37)-C(2))-methylthiotransferase [Fibrobacter sp. UWEL]|uniref:tRNA (N(6)-L-threonylcarbamoyladenosine(37)-C(2))- methylthiotransferase n=1 Tax=Fibrobacter sp. UWEL TaxID=1896209 RepID=UPI00091E92EC|nr:tRNA (N(6)-L-threonylcarbamoyladenosine(37)-C(2))-methylthiotransferase [Fibrobacter sp. UWEL]SHK54902.1 MiaB-like tRNA modifying enzyme [Fibrobacter sp. UWEL]
MENLKPELRIISQGCAANFGEGEKIARVFQDEYDVKFGQPLTSESKPAAYVLNVCTVKGNAGAIKLLRQAIDNAPDAKIFITGCAPKDFREEALRITSRIVFTDIKELTREIVPQEMKKNIAKDSAVLRESPLVGIVNIESGCLDACSYCSTRLVKGRLQSYPAKEIVQQVAKLVADGCHEIQLTGQDCGCYGFDLEETSDQQANPAGPRNLAELVQKILAEVPGDYRMRLGMGNPRHILRYKDALMDCFSDPRVYKFIHLPVQSGSEHTLQDMNRKHSARDYADLANEFNKRFPLFTLSTDLIVGFPGETDQDFADTMSILRETRPTVCNITRFVSRPGTPAARMTNPVPDEIKHKRSAELAAAFQEIAQQNNARWIGQTESVTVEKSGYRKGTLIARNDAYRPVAIQVTDEAQYAPGIRLNVRITAAEPFALIAEVI